MPDLTFRIEGASPVAYAVSPQIALAMRVVNSHPEQAIQSALLRCQIQIDAAARPYEPHESEALRDLFGDGAMRGRAMRRLAWTQTSVVIPPFTHDATFEVQAPCTYDMCVSTAKYFQALSLGGAPIAVLFSGTVFHRDADGALRASPVPWSTEARFTVEAQVWRDAVADHYAGIAPLPLRQDVFERLDRYRRDNSLPTWDHVIERLLVAEGRRPS
jgi:Family of unknown function (DUF6084)